MHLYLSEEEKRTIIQKEIDWHTPKLNALRLNNDEYFRKIGWIKVQLELVDNFYYREMIKNLWIIRGNGDEGIFLPSRPREGDHINLIASNRYYIANWGINYEKESDGVYDTVIARVEKIEMESCPLSIPFQDHIRDVTQSYHPLYKIHLSVTDVSNLSSIEP